MESSGDELFARSHSSSPVPSPAPLQDEEEAAPPHRLFANEKTTAKRVSYFKCCLLVPFQGKPSLTCLYQHFPVQSKKNTLTNDQRKRLCERYAEGDLTQKALGEWGRIEFNLSAPIHQPTLSRYLTHGKKGVYNDMNSTELTAKRVNDVVNKELDETLAAWVLKCQQAGAALTGLLIIQKGETLAETMQPAPSFSHGWLYNFLVRHKLQGVKMHGESGSVDQEALQAARTKTSAAAAKLLENSDSSIITTRKRG